MDKANIAHRFEDAERTDDVRLNSMMPFDKMMLRDPLHRGLREAGFIYPTIIQALAIPAGKSGTDLLVQSKSGTGKTLIFTIVILEEYRDTINGPQALVVVPTRELAVQINEVIKMVGRFMNDFRTLAVTGGVPYEIHRACVPSAKVVIGTPGRLVHLLDSGILNTSEINMLVYDEADKLFTKSFISDIKRIRKALRADVQTIACSATFDDGLDKELAKTMRNPMFVSTATRSTPLLGIKQFVYELPEEKSSILEMRAKLKTVNDIFARVKFKQCLIFASTKMRADSYLNYLVREGWSCEMISGSMEQEDRLEKFLSFRECKTRILIATDVMSRGIDSLHANLVINLELPIDLVTYLHRIGRAGRFGSHGIAISVIASRSDSERWQCITAPLANTISVLKFPHSDLDAVRDLWDFSDFSADIKCYGLYGVKVVSSDKKNAKQEDTKKLSQEIDEDSQNAGRDSNGASNGGSVAAEKKQHVREALVDKREQMEELPAALEMVDLIADRVNGIGGVSYANAHSPIDTGTFQVDSRESAVNIPDICYDISVREMLPQPLPSVPPLAPKSSSNTIDDASSIDVDSSSYDCEGVAPCRNEHMLEDREPPFTFMPDAFDQYDMDVDDSQVTHNCNTSNASHSEATSVTVTAEMDGTGRDTTPDEKADGDALNTELNDISVVLTEPIVSSLETQQPVEPTVQSTLRNTSLVLRLAPPGLPMVAEPSKQKLRFSKVEHLDIPPEPQAPLLLMPRIEEPIIYLADQSEPEFPITPVVSGSVCAAGGDNEERLLSINEVGDNTSDNLELGRPLNDGSGDGARVLFDVHEFVYQESDESDEEEGEKQDQQEGEEEHDEKHEENHEEDHEEDDEEEVGEEDGEEDEEPESSLEHPNVILPPPIVGILGSNNVDYFAHDVADTPSSSSTSSGSHNVFKNNNVTGQDANQQDRFSKIWQNTYHKQVQEMQNYLQFFKDCQKLALKKHDYSSSDDE